MPTTRCKDPCRYKVGNLPNPEDSLFVYFAGGQPLFGETLVLFFLPITVKPHTSPFPPTHYSTNDHTIFSLPPPRGTWNIFCFFCCFFSIKPRLCSSWDFVFFSFLFALRISFCGAHEWFNDILSVSFFCVLDVFLHRLSI